MLEIFLLMDQTFIPEKIQVSGSIAVPKVSDIQVQVQLKNETFST